MSKFSHDISALEKNVDALYDIFELFLGSQKRDELKALFHLEWFTTPAEFALIAAALEAMVQQAGSVTSNYAAVKKAVAMVGQGR